MTDVELVADHVERFNHGVRSGDFGPMLERFADDSVLEFEGVPVGPFHGIEAIRTAYREQPPDDEIDVGEPRLEGDTVIAEYAWRRDEGRRAGELRLTARDGLITHLVVGFDEQPG